MHRPQLETLHRLLRAGGAVVKTIDANDNVKDQQWIYDHISQTLFCSRDLLLDASSLWPYASIVSARSIREVSS